MPCVHIGSVTVPHGLLLAPMAGVTDAAFRALCKKFGAEYTVSEMISAKALCFEQNGKGTAPVRTAPLAEVEADSAPMAVQLFGSEPEFLARAAAMLESGEYRGRRGSLPPAAVDINMGCPVEKVVRNGEGSALLRDPARAEAIVRAVVRAVRLPVTVKLRAGWDADSINAPELAKRLEDAGAAAICIHGRTRRQFYQPGSDMRVIAAVKAAVSVPVIGNGDLFTAADVKRMLDTTGCDGVMIARGALGNPFLFEETLAMLEGRAYTPPTTEKRLAVAFSHAADIVARKGERIGVPEARKHLAWYTKGLRGAPAVRDALMHVSTLEEVRKVLARLAPETE